MASKKEISKRLKSAKEGKPTWQDKARLKTWKAYKAGSQKTQGYQRAKRNIKKDKQMGRKPNEVDLQIVKSYVPQTKDQMKADRIKAGIWAAGLVGGPVAGKGIGLAAKTVGKRILSKRAAAEATKKAAAKREAAALKKRVARARKAAEAKKTMELARIAGETGRRAGHDKIVKAAGTKAANRARKAAEATQTTKRVAQQAENLRRTQRIAGASLLAVPIVAGGVTALRGDTPKKSAAAKPKPGAADKTRSPSRADPEKGIGAGRERAAKKKRKAEEGRHAEEFVGTGPRGAVDPKHILDDQLPESKRGYNFLKGGKQEVTLPKFLGGGKMTVDSSDAAFDYMDDPELNLKGGGRLKKKTKPRKRAALRGHRAELRGG